MGKEQFRSAYAKILAKAWTDEAFKQRLLASPRTVLEEHGIDAPEGIEFKVVEQTNSVIHLILPPRPVSGEITAEALEKRDAAGWTSGPGCCL